MAIAPFEYLPTVAWLETIIIGICQETLMEGGEWAELTEANQNIALAECAKVLRQQAITSRMPNPSDGFIDPDGNPIEWLNAATLGHCGASPDAAESPELIACVAAAHAEITGGATRDAKKTNTGMMLLAAAAVAWWVFAKKK